MTDNEESGNADIISKKISRRKALGRIGKIGIAAVAVAAVGGVGGYLALNSQGPSSKTTTSSLTTASSQNLATAKPGDRFLIGNITFTLTNEPGYQIDQGASQAAAALGLDYKTIDIGMSSTAPLDAARELISSGAKGIISYFIDAGVTAEVARLCQQNKVFFSNTYSFLPFTYPWSIGDYFLLQGEQPGWLDTAVVSKLLFQKLGGNGIIAHLQGSPATPNAEKNYGIYQAWQKYPNIQLAGHLYGGWAADTAKTAMQQIMSANSTLNGATSVNDSMAVGCVQADSAVAGLSVGTDGVKTAMQYVSQGNLLVTTSFLPPYMGGRQVCMLYDAITGAYYPSTNERLWNSNNIIVGKDTNTITQLAQSANLQLPFTVATADDVLAKVFNVSQYPWDWTRVSRGKAKERNLQYDPLGGFLWGGWRSTIQAFGNDGTGDTYSKFVYDVLARFNDFKADTFSQLSSAPYAPTSSSPSVDPGAAYAGLSVF